MVEYLPRDLHEALPQRRRTRLPRETAKQVDRGLFIERLVEVAALRRLNAGRASGFARTGLDNLERTGQKPIEQLEAFFRHADAARIAVVDEDRRAFGF